MFLLKKFYKDSVVVCCCILVVLCITDIQTSQKLPICVFYVYFLSYSDEWHWHNTHVHCEEELSRLPNLHKSGRGARGKLNTNPYMLSAL